MVPLNSEQAEVLHGIIDAYELREAEALTVVDVAQNSGISLGLAGRLLYELKDLGLVACSDDGVITDAANNGYYP